ncbi:MAG TPA: amino acid adenylation domain-containing protein, partial [Longimicrobium sp.]|nr:amino acid adenylation domain-containing protein [Longimicrobium sp.]
YGPSETHVVTALALEGDPAGWPLLPGIGGPIANTRCYVLDARLRPVPIGIPGELYLGGDSLARGYLGRPALTAERFSPDPFASVPGARVYRTGDRVRWLADGGIEFLGRTDEQVKIRGFRIEPGEVEAVLSAHEAVREAVVVVREDAPGDRRLVAYVVAGEPAAVTPAELRAHLKGRLPEYMVPSAVVVVDSLPLTPSGKVARQALPAPEYAAAETGHVAPRTLTEEVLAGIWAEVLRLKQVGVEENFFALGGHSLLATRVVSRIREVFAIELPLRALFEGPTVAELAVRVEEIRRAGLPVLPPVVPVERARALPLSFAQERLWFIDRMEPGSTVYNMPMALRLGGALDQAALERSLSEIVRRHETLRTTFAEVDGSPVQVIAPFGGFAVPVEDLSALSEPDREAAVGRRAGEEAARPFDLSAGPLFHAALLRLGEEDHVLLLSMHHVVSDGWSLGVLFRELSALYAAYREGGESPLAELAVQYADYAVWQREQLAGEALDRQLSYWRERLADAPALLELPTDHPRPPVQTHRGATVPVELSPELLERLQRLGRSEGTTLYMTLLGAFQVLLGKYAGSEDVVVGSPIAGRTRAEVEALIGFFVNTLVLRTDLSGDPSFREVLRRVREATLGAYENQEVPFEKLVAELQPERSLSHAPLFQVMFTVQNAEGRGDALAGLEVSGAGAAIEIARFDLSLTLAATPRGLRGGLNYGTDLFERGTVERMLGHLARVLEQVAADADVRLSRLALLGGAERALVLEAWNRTEAEYPADRCLHQLFEAQVRRTPGAVAVVFEGATLTYDELDRRANRLAHRLIALGVCAEDRVALCVEPSPDAIAALLGILKAGAAYVAADLAAPDERIAFMLDESSVRVVVAGGAEAARPWTAGRAVVEAGEDLARFPATAPAVWVTPRNLAYVVYTSGSTGLPKGVLAEHGGVCNAVAAFSRIYEIVPGHRVLLFAPLHFDASVMDIFTALTTGAALVGAPREALIPGDELVSLLEREGVTHAKFTPSALAALPPAPLPALRAVMVGGEICGAELVARWAPGRRFFNGYGPTETSVRMSVFEAADGTRPPPLGAGTANVRVYVLDAAGEPLPVGVPGEVCIGGVQVTRGYLARPALTAERFVPDPFSAQPGARLYRSGDRMRWRGDGTLEFVGRIDHQVKIRGFRIELGEIEAALRRIEGVADCVVVAREDEPGEKRLVAYVVGGVEEGVLRDRLRRTLPEYMVPSAFVALDALPVTPNGKLDRRALPAPELASPEEAYVAPRTPVEEVLAGIWAEVLRLGRVGVHDNFFDLGGHSLLATRVVSRVRATFKQDISIRTVFSMPTLEAMAGEIERRIYEAVAAMSEAEAEQLARSNPVAGA